MQIARIAIAVYLFFLAAIGVLAGVSLLGGENEDLTATGELVVGVFWLASALLFTTGGVLLLRRPMITRTLLVVVGVLLLGGVVISLNPYFGVPLTAAAVLIAILGFAR